MEEDIKTDGKDERGRWATLFDPSPYENTVGRWKREDRLHLNIMEEAAHNVTYPFRHVNVFEDGVDEGVRDGVKGPSSVEEENIVLLRAREAGVKLLSEGVHVVSANPRRDKPFLVRVEEQGNGRCDRVSKGFSNQPVGGVCDGDGARVAGKHSSFFGEKVEEGIVETSRGGESVRKVGGYVRENLRDGGINENVGSKESEGNTIRAWGRVGGARYQICKISRRRGGGEMRGNGSGVRGEIV